MNPMMIQAILSGLTMAGGAMSRPGNPALDAAKMMPGMANQFYADMWRQMQGGLMQNAMQGARASEGNFRSSMGGTGAMNTGLGKMGLALNKGTYFNAMNANQMGLRDRSWQYAMSMFPQIAAGGMNAQNLRYGLMGAGINGMGNAALNWKGGKG